MARSPETRKLERLYCEAREPRSVEGLVPRALMAVAGASDVQGDRVHFL